MKKPRPSSLRFVLSPLRRELLPNPKSSRASRQFPILINASTISQRIQMSHVHLMVLLKNILIVPKGHHLCLGSLQKTFQRLLYGFHPNDLERDPLGQIR
jgi:hypothetical protein